MINRAVLLLKYKSPAIRWVNDADPYEDRPGITDEDVNTERTAYLIPNDASDGPKELEAWLKANYGILFETELEGWYTDPGLWPQKRSYALFKQWFTPECHSVVEDTVGTPIYDEDS